jgi:hypothetical protein
MYVVVAADRWKARNIAADSRVAVTVPVRRGGILSLVAPIPPAAISFHATAIVHPAGSPGQPALPGKLTSLLPPPDRSSSSVIEIRPAGDFVTYGIGVPLLRMRIPDLTRGRAPVNS